MQVHEERRQLEAQARARECEERAKAEQDRKRALVEQRKILARENDQLRREMQDKSFERSSRKEETKKEQERSKANLKTVHIELLRKRTHVKDLMTKCGKTGDVAAMRRAVASLGASATSPQAGASQDSLGISSPRQTSPREGRRRSTQSNQSPQAVWNAQLGRWARSFEPPPRT